MSGVIRTFPSAIFLISSIAVTAFLPERLVLFPVRRGGCLADRLDPLRLPLAPELTPSASPGRARWSFCFCCSATFTPISAVTSSPADWPWRGSSRWRSWRLPPPAAWRTSPSAARRYPPGLGLHQLLRQLDLADEHGDALHVVLLKALRARSSALVCSFWRSA